MNSSQWFQITMMYKIYKALYEVYEEKSEEWDSLSKKDLVGEVMVRTKGHYNPEMVQKLIDEI